MPAPALPSYHFDLTQYAESVGFLKTISAEIDRNYWSNDDDGVWRVTTETDEVRFPADFVTLYLNDGVVFHSKALLSSMHMSHKDARTLAMKLGKLVDANAEQLALLEAWPGVPKGSLTQVVAIKVRTNGRTFDIEIREAFDHRLPGRVLFTMYDTTNTDDGKKDR